MRAQLVTIDRGTDMEGMEEYNSSFSMKGICVELTVVVRPRCLMKTLTTAYPVDANLPAKLLQVVCPVPMQPCFTPTRLHTPYDMLFLKPLPCVARRVLDLVCPDAWHARPLA